MTEQEENQMLDQRVTSMVQDTSLAAAALGLMDQEEAPDQLTVEKLDQKLKQIRELDDQYKVAKAAATAIGNEVDKLKAEMLSILDALDRKNYTLPGVGMASKVTEKRYRLPEDTAQRQSVFAYIEQQYGTEAMLGYLTINAQKFNSFVNEEVANGKEVPHAEAPTVETYVKFLRR